MNRDGYPYSVIQEKIVSEWYEAKEIDIDDGEFNVLFDQNSRGNSYVTVSFQQVLEMYEKLPAEYQDTIVPQPLP